MYVRTIAQSIGVPTAPQNAPSGAFAASTRAARALWLWPTAPLTAK